jgi:hypothetical protein
MHYKWNAEVTWVCEVFGWELGRCGYSAHHLQSFTAVRREPWEHFWSNTKTRKRLSKWNVYHTLAALMQQQSRFLKRCTKTISIIASPSLEGKLKAENDSFLHVYTILCPQRWALVYRWVPRQCCSIHLVRRSPEVTSKQCICSFHK